MNLFKLMNFLSTILIGGLILNASQNRQYDRHKSKVSKNSFRLTRQQQSKQIH